EGYAEVEYVENLIENTADSFSQSIESVKKLVPTSYENRNYILNSEQPNVRSQTYMNFDPTLSEKLIEGQEDVYSFEVRADVDNYSNRIFLTNGITEQMDIYFTDEWTRYSVPFVYNGGEYSGHQLNPHLYPSPEGRDTIELRRVKLEKGTVATDWSPAPEDLQNEVTILRSDYERTAEEVTDRLTKIDGNNGYINEIRR